MDIRTQRMALAAVAARSPSQSGLPLKRAAQRGGIGGTNHPGAAHLSGRSGGPTDGCWLGPPTGPPGRQRTRSGGRLNGASSAETGRP